MWENAQPAYAERFGVAGAHLSRRSESEGGTPNIQLRKRSRAGVQFRGSNPQLDVQRSVFGVCCCDAESTRSSTFLSYSTEFQPGGTVPLSFSGRTSASWRAITSSIGFVLLFPGTNAEVLIEACESVALADPCVECFVKKPHFYV